MNENTYKTQSGAVARKVVTGARGDRTVHDHDYGVEILGHMLGMSATAALWEFFQHERDEELGRWRYVDEFRGVWVCYPQPDGRVRVVDESTGISHVYARGETSGPGTVISCAYFEAHPENKPWHDAKPGEVWVFKGKSSEPMVFIRRHEAGWVNIHGGVVAETPKYDGRPYGYSHDPHFEPRRVWPEGV